ncbi:MAG TPA: helix-turn-helix domain-containing protein [Solirubrobacterales bacterium]|nr:helix-turn-helix domain-containing protein [Solirubrobacterales bacterium]
MKLRETRLQRGLDLAEVAAATKIQTRFLVAIENEEWDLLPGEFYARSFIRSYADYLDLDDIGAAELSEASIPTAAEQLPRIEPEPPQEAHYVRRKRLSARLLAVLATLGLGAVALAVALSSQNGDSGPPLTKSNGDQRRQVVQSPAEQPAARSPGASLTLTATAEVWVCLLDGRGQELIDGQILGPGSEQGPYRSDGFTVSLGNGAVTMNVGGRAASIPPTPNPIGFAIGRDGALRELPEGERPTCT